MDYFILFNIQQMFAECPLVLQALWIQGIQTGEDSCPQGAHDLEDFNIHGSSFLHTKSYASCLRPHSGERSEPCDSRAKVLTGRRAEREQCCLFWGRFVTRKPRCCLAIFVTGIPISSPSGGPSINRPWIVEGHPQEEGGREIFAETRKRWALCSAWV